MEKINEKEILIYIRVFTDFIQIFHKKRDSRFRARTLVPKPNEDKYAVVFKY